MSGTGDDRGAMLEPMRRIIDAIEGAAALDRLAVSAQETARPLSRGRLGQALRGTGSAMPSTPCSQTCRWGAGSPPDCARWARSRAAQRLTGLGLVMVPPTAAAGITDWSTAPTAGARRVGTVHGIGNLVVALLYLRSW
jgi:hypothetical protein